MPIHQSMRVRLLVLILLGVVLLPSVAALAQTDCDDPLGCVVLRRRDPITLGFMLTLSGATAPLGEDVLGGVQIALDDRGGQLLGREVRLVGQDSRCSAEGGLAAAERLLENERIVAVIGTSCSSAAVAALPLLSEAGWVLFSPSATSPRLTSEDPAIDGAYLPGFFRTIHNDLFQGTLAAEFAYNVLEARTLATIHDGSPYADNLQQVMVDRFIELGGSITFQGAIAVGDFDMMPILSEVAANPPDVVYYPIFEPESIFLTAQARITPQLNTTFLMIADASLNASFPINTGTSAEGVYVTGAAVTGEAYDEFLAKWVALYQSAPPSSFHAHAYDAANMIMTAIESVAIVDSSANTITIGRQALRDAIAGLRDFEGVTGSLTCTPTGDCATGEALGVFELTEAQLEGVWPPPLIYTPRDAADE